MILRRIARPMLAAVFVSGGIATLRDPKPRVDAAGPVVDKAADKVPNTVTDRVPTDAETLVKINAAAQIGAGIAFGLGRFPRLAALVLAGSTVPTTLAAHRFWEKDDPAERAREQIQFLKNLGLVGGLLIAAADTHGKPSVTWRARHAARSAVDSARDTASSVMPGH